MTHLFTEKEKRTRKLWLILQLIMPCVSCLSIFLTPETSLPNDNAVALMGPDIAMVVFCAFLLIFYSIWFTANYQLAYKRPGTKLLTFQIILFIIGFLGTLPPTLKSLIFSSYDLFAFGCAQLLFAAWTVSLLMRMRKINMSIKKARKEFALQGN